MTSLAAADLDSQRFGRRIGRAVISTASDARAVVAEFLATDLDITVLRYPSGRFDIFAACLANGIEVLHADTLVHFVGPPNSRGETDSPPSPYTAELNTVWSNELHVAYASAFAGYVNHYAANPVVDSQRVVAGYLEWAEAHVLAADQQLISLRSRAGDLVAVAAVSIDTAALAIDLAGVLPDFRRVGAYDRLLAELEHVATDHGCSSVQISTQVNNRAAIRAWIRRGWNLDYAEQTVHLVRPRLSGTALDDERGTTGL